MEGALIIADSEEMALTNMTLDYFINDNGTCTCKLCGDSSARVTNGRKEMWYRYNRTRKRFVEHLTNIHPSNCQSLASQLEVAPGEKLKALMFEALWPDLHDVWSKMTRLHEGR